MASWIVDFYRGSRADAAGRMLDAYWAWEEQTLESHHDFIQWMFPLTEPSAFNPDAPLLTEKDRQAFADDEILRQNLRRSLKVLLHFLGLQMQDNGSVIRGENFAQRMQIWSRPNHNWLRITRVLRSLRLLGLEAEAIAVWTRLRDLHERDGVVSASSFAYWRAAAEDALP